MWQRICGSAKSLTVEIFRNQAEAGYTGKKKKKKKKDVFAAMRAGADPW